LSSHSVLNSAHPHLKQYFQLTKIGYIFTNLQNVAFRHSRLKVLLITHKTKFFTIKIFRLAVIWYMTEQFCIFFKLKSTWQNLSLMSPTHLMSFFKNHFFLIIAAHLRTILSQVIWYENKATSIEKLWIQCTSLNIV